MNINENDKKEEKFFESNDNEHSEEINDETNQ